jgi:hypothetical protein
MGNGGWWGQSGRGSTQRSPRRLLVPEPHQGLKGSGWLATSWQAGAGATMGVNVNVNPGAHKSCKKADFFDADVWKPPRQARRLETRAVQVSATRGQKPLHHIHFSCRICRPSTALQDSWGASRPPSSSSAPLELRAANPCPSSCVCCEHVVHTPRTPSPSV